jgi:hypothetical protein
VSVEGWSIDARVARVESEVMAAALIALWLALEVAWRWRRLRSRL